MPRIPDEWLERLKQEVSLVQLAERTGLELKRVGQELVGLCVFHDDSTPSLSIRPDRNVFQCFGCGAAGTSIDWVMRQKAVDFREAVELLLAEFFPSVARDLLGDKAQSRRSRAPELPCPFDFGADDQELLAQYVDFCHTLYQSNDEPRGYARKRGIDDPELVSRFKLGYQDRSLGLRLPTKETKAGAEVRKRFESLGLLRESGHAAFNGSLLIPTVDPSGRVTAIYGRKTRDDLNKHSSPKHLYLAGKDRDVFNEEAFSASKELILCEARLDALAFWRWGFRNVTACRGAQNLSDALVDAFEAYGIERCTIAFDHDEAGDKGALSAAGKLMAVGVECFRIRFPRGLDANDVALKMQPADKSLALFVRSAEWMGKGRRPEAPQPGPLENVVVTAKGPSEATEESKTEAAEEENSLKPAPDAAPACPTVRFAQPEPPPDAAVPGLVKLTDDEAELLFEDRRYRVRGLRKCNGYGSLKVTVRAEREGISFEPPSPIAGWHLDNLDLYTHRARQSFEKTAAHELGLRDEVIRFDLGKIVRLLEAVQEQRLAEASKPKVKTVTLSEKETEEAIAFWKSADLFTRIAEDYTRCGLVGERTNKIAAYIASTSRLLERPLAIIIQSSSAAGKSTLMEKTLAFMPEEMREKYTAVSGKSLFYFDEGMVLRHKILAIVEEEGAEKATYPLKILNSEGELIMASTGKDPQTGKLVTKVYKVEGPVMIILTTTSVDIDPELENRCLRLTVDESREQTKAIHELQRMAMTYEGHLLDVERESTLRLHRNAQRLLRTVRVHNPYANYLTFVDDQTRTRRDHAKYLVLIQTIALMHQFQRPIHRRDLGGKSEEYIDVTLSDLELAGRLIGEIVGQHLGDLQTQTRVFLNVLDDMVTKLCQETGVERCDLRFSQRQIRDLTAWSDAQVRVHLGRLIGLEYVLQHRGSRGHSYVYELLYNGEGRDGAPFVLGLVDVEKLRGEEPSTTLDPRGSEGRFEGGSSPIRGLFVAHSMTGQETSESASQTAFGGLELQTARNALLPPATETRSYPAVIAGTNGNGTNGHRILVNLLKLPPRGRRPAGEGGDAPRAGVIKPIPKPKKPVPPPGHRPLRRVLPSEV